MNNDDTDKEKVIIMNTAKKIEDYNLLQEIEELEAELELFEKNRPPRKPIDFQTKRLLTQLRDPQFIISLYKQGKKV